MQYRDVDIQPPMGIVDAGTATIDIDVTQPLTELEVVMALTNAGAQAQDLPISQIVSRIELVDGGTVYASLDGSQAAAGFAYDAGKYPPIWIDQRANQGQNFTFPIRFGRYLGDQLRNFDPTKLRNPQIRITWINNALHLAGSKTLGVRAKIMDGVPGASSCLFTTAVRAFVTVAAGIEVTELPTDYPIRTLYVHPYVIGRASAMVVTNLRLDCDEGKFIAFDRGGWSMCEAVEEIYGCLSVRQAVNVTNGARRETWIGVTHGCVATTDLATTFANATVWDDPFVLVMGGDFNGLALANANVTLLATGAVPHGMMAIPFGIPDDPASWLNAAAYRKVKLLLTQGFAGALCTILVQQDRPL